MAVVFKKKKQPNRSEEQKLRPFEFCLSGGHGPDHGTKSLDFDHLPSGELKQKESLTSRFPPYWRCGPISTRIGAYENQDFELFGVGMFFSFGWFMVEVFCQ